MRLASNQPSTAANRAGAAPRGSGLPAVDAREGHGALLAGDGPPVGEARSGRDMRLALACFLALILDLAPATAADCSGTSVGAVPLIDLGPGTYLGYEGGLYPGGTTALPASHAADAGSLARIQLLDPNGIPDAVSGLAVLLSVGMSNTTQEFSRFIQIANSLPGRNQAVRIVDGAQGGWAAARVADPNQNAAFWSAIDQRLANAGVTPLQVQAVWLKEAEASPSAAFPLHAQILRNDLRKIVRIIQDRYPGTRQVYLSSRTYAGYASTGLNPEMFAYESGFSVKWLIEEQLGGSAALNFDPAAGTVESAWLAWGPYLWADGLTPRSDGLTWECADFSASDGTHPSTSGRQKVASLLLEFFSTDALPASWFMDCSPSDPGSFSAPARVLDLEMVGQPGSVELRWEDLRPSSGASTVHDVVAGSLGDLRATGSFAGAACIAAGSAASSLADPSPDPPIEDGTWYLVRGRNGCGSGTYAEPTALPLARDALDASSPCP